MVPFAPRGGNDVIARLLARKLSDSLGQQVVVENRPGAGGNIGIGYVAKSAPDGYTILTVTNSFMVNPSLYANAPYDPFKDFVPLTLIASSPNVLAVHPSFPANTLTELIAVIKSHPGKYSIASGGSGTTSQLSIEQFKLTLGLDLTAVPFNGAAPAIQSTIAGHTPLTIIVLPSTVPHIKAGQLRALAVTSSRRSPTVPDVPTMAEAGVAGQETETIQGALVPAGTPQSIVARLHEEIVKALALPDVKERITSLGFTVVANKPGEFGAQISAEVAKWSKLIKAANIKPD